eukprot:745247_1
MSLGNLDRQIVLISAWSSFITLFIWSMLGRCNYINCALDYSKYTTLRHALYYNKARQRRNRNADVSTNFTGIWQLASAHNVENYLKSEGIGYIKRKLWAMVTATYIIKHYNDDIHLSVNLPISELNFYYSLDGKKREIIYEGDKVNMSAMWYERKQ